MSTIIAVADAVASELNAGTFSQAFTAQRHYVAEFPLEELGVLHVSIVPAGVPMIQARDRSRLVREVQVYVVIQKKAAEKPALDLLMNFVEEIVEFLALRSLAAYPAAAWARTENAPAYAPDRLRQDGLFESALAITFRVAN